MARSKGSSIEKLMERLSRRLEAPAASAPATDRQAANCECAAMGPFELYSWITVAGQRVGVGMMNDAESNVLLCVQNRGRCQHIETSPVIILALFEKYLRGRRIAHGDSSKE